MAVHFLGKITGLIKKGRYATNNLLNDIWFTFKGHCIQLALHSVNEVHMKWIKRCKVEASQKINVHETQSDDSQVAFVSMEQQRNYAAVSQQKGYTHSFNTTD